MKKINLLLALAMASSALVGCGQKTTQAPITASPAPSATSTLPPTATYTNIPIAAVNPSATPGPSLTPTKRPTFGPSPTPTLTATPTLPPLEVIAQEITASAEWAMLGLPAEQAAAWEAFARQGQALDEAQKTTLLDFALQWRTYQDLLKAPRVPKGGAVALRARHVKDGERLELYAVSPEDEKPYLMAVNAAGRPMGLVLAPDFPELTAGMSDTPGLVAYRDTQGQTLLLADARQLDAYEWTEKDKDKQLTSDQALYLSLEQAYLKSSAFVRAGLYPRYYFPVDGIRMGFFYLERSLSLQQVVHMRDAFLLFDRPDLQPLKPALFGEGTSMIIYAELLGGGALGLTHTGTSVMELNRKDLLGNRYEVAQVMAHEGAHVVQGGIPRHGDTCNLLLRMEVANKTIPDGFLDWSAEELLKGVREKKIGTYHVSYWVLNRVDPKNRSIPWIKSVIATGTSNGYPIVMCR